MHARTRHLSADLAAAASVAAVSLGVSFDALRRLDVRFGDETIYLAAGLSPSTAEPIAKSSALYAEFYRALSFVEPDPARLYYASWLILTAALPLLLFALARRAGAPTWAATAAAFVWATSGAVLVWPFVSKFATLVLALGALAALHLRARFASRGALVAAFLLAGYARPELVTPAWAGAALYVAWALGTARAAPRRLVGAAAIAALALVLGARYGTPFVANRSYEAFEQHYALNVADAREAVDATPEDDGASADPWNAPDAVTREAFGGAESVLGALRANPRAVLWHMKQNARNLPGAAATVLRPLTDGTGPLRPLALACLFALTLGAATSFLRARGSHPPRARAFTPLVAAVGLSALAATLVIYPREHYLVPLGLLALARLAAACEALALPRRYDARAATGLALVGLFAVAPATQRALAPAEGPSALEGQATIKALGALDLPDGAKILEADIGRGTYVAKGTVSLGPWEKAEGEPLFAFLDEHEVDVVVVDDRLRNDPRFADALADEGVASRAAEAGYDVVPVPHTTVTLLVRTGDDDDDKGDEVPSGDDADDDDGDERDG